MHPQSEEMVKISVILPVYNVATYLDETFHSLLNQSLKEIEIIAVNDGSTDESEEIIKKYAQQDARISYYNQENQGQSVARNQALQYATGEYIYMMDSDDVLDNLDALQICYDYAEKCKADFIFFDGETLQEEGAAPISWNYHRTQELEEGKAYGGEFLLNMMLGNSKHNCVVWLLLINHNYLKRIALDFYPGIIHEDELYTTKLTTAIATKDNPIIRAVRFRKIFLSPLTIVVQKLSLSIDTFSVPLSMICSKISPDMLFFAAIFFSIILFNHYQK